MREGEILGLCGIDGNGQTELIQALTGLAPIESGSVTIQGVDITDLPVKQRLDSGLGHIPEDRHRHGLVLDFRLDENMVIHSYGSEPFSKHGILDYGAIRKNASYNFV